MSCSKLSVSWGVALSVLMGILVQPLAAQVYPTMSLPKTYSGSLRMVEGYVPSPPAAPYGGSQTVTVKGGNAQGWCTVSGDLGTDPLVVNNTDWYPNPNASFLLGFDWDPSISQLGPVTGTITLTDNTNSNDSANHAMTVNGDILQNRVLTASLGSYANPARTMAGGTLIATLSTGRGAKNSDSQATRVLLENGSIFDSSGVTVKYKAPATTGHMGTAATSTLLSSAGQTASLNFTIPKTWTPGQNPYSGSIDITPLLADGEAKSVGATVLPVGLNYNVDVLQNRTFTVLPARVMLNASSAQMTLSTGDTDADLDSEATRVGTVPGGSVTAGGMTVTFANNVGAPLTAPVFNPVTGTYQNQFNGQDQTAMLKVTLPSSMTSKAGPHGGNFNLAAGTGGNQLLVSGEAASVGAAVQGSVTYSMAVLAPRQLTVKSGPATLNNTLSGSYVTTTVTSTNANTGNNYVTSVTVAPNGASNGYVTVPATTISSSALSITGASNNQVYGQLTAGPGTYPTSNLTLPVQTAEAASVHDTTKYKSLTASYGGGNVGTASLSPTNASGFGPTLTGFVPQGFTLGSFAAASPSNPNPANVSLTSKVIATSTTSNGGSIYGPVGSEADIVTSTPVSGNTTVTEAWRARTAYEANAPGNGGPPPGGALPSGIRWLCSDVVSVGINSASTASAPVIYAMQMSFDEGINTHFDGAGATALKEFQANSLYLAQLTPTGWQNAVASDGVYGGIYGSNAVTHVWDSLSDFLTNQYQQGYTLENLLGSWGVDPSGQAWAIIDHPGTMAVVPEPATVLLLIPAGALILCYRRWRRQGRPGRKGG